MPGHVLEVFLIEKTFVYHGWAVGGGGGEGAVLLVTRKFLVQGVAWLPVFGRGHIGARQMLTTVNFTHEIVEIL